MAALAARIEGCLRIGPEAALGPDALDEARQLARLTSPRYTCDAEAVMLLATFHLHRWHALPDGEDAWDAEQMAQWLAVAARIDPRLVPPPFQAVKVSRPGGPASIDLMADHAQAAALVMRFEDDGDARLLDRGIAVWQEGLDQLRCEQLAPRAGILVQLSAALTRRSEISASGQDADEAVAAAREAVRITPPGHQLHSTALAHLGVALKNRFELSGDRPDLTEAITAGRGAVAPGYHAHPGRAKFLNNLANTLRLSFESVGRLADLDEAVALSREAMSGAAPDEAPVIQANRAGILQLRFEATGNPADVDEAVRLGRAAVVATPAGHPDLARRLHNLGGALQAQALVRVRPGDCAEVVRVAREALAAAADEHPARAMYLTNLVDALRLQLFVAVAPGTVDAGQHDRDLAEMVQLARAAVELTPAGHPDRAGYLNNLGIVLRMRATLADLDQAAAAAREAVASTPADHPNWCPHMSNLGNAMAARFLRTRADRDFREAIRSWAGAARAETGAAQVRLAAAIAWGRLAAAENDRANAAEGFAYGVSLLPVVAWRGLERAVQEENLARWRGLASDAAAWAIRNGEPERAVEILERGRSVLWTQQLHLRTEADQLAEVAPSLYAALEDTRRALDSAGGRRDVSARAAGGPGAEQAAAQRRRLAERWDLLVRQVRELPGLEDFLAPVPFGKLRGAAAEGPVVIVNTSIYGCKALVVSGERPQVVPLPALHHDEVVSRAQGLLAALGRAIGGDDDDLDDTLTSILGWLWTSVARPVLDALGLTERLGPGEPDARRRLWWCPAGALTMLPLHAAGLYGQENAAVPERVISSYTPTLSALQRSRQPRAARTGPPLLVGVPDAPGAPPLRKVHAELERTRKHVWPATTLEGEHATRAGVLNAMADHGWVHLACHGRQDAANPAASSVLLADGPLSILDIAERKLADCDLAYLSACQTFTGDLNLADEAIHLASAFQMAGYRHVVATLWAINDALAPRVADSVYRALGHDGVPDPARAADAIHHAVAELRKLVPELPHVWAPYVHIGP